MFVCDYPIKFIHDSKTSGKSAPSKFNYLYVNLKKFCCEEKKEWVGGGIRVSKHDFNKVCQYGVNLPSIAIH